MGFCYFVECPPIGTKLTKRKNEYVLIDTEDYTRKSDGKASKLLFWVQRTLMNDGRTPLVVCSGLKSNSPSRVKKFKNEWWDLISPPAQPDPFS